MKHELEEIGQELLAIVDNGGRVQNILIDHPVYGEIETLLKLTCRRDVQHFLEQVENSDFRPLSELTDGIHYHLVEAETQQDLHYIEEALDQLGYLVRIRKFSFPNRLLYGEGRKIQTCQVLPSSPSRVAYHRPDPSLESGLFAPKKLLLHLKSEGYQRTQSPYNK